jgi:hypothetical protein
MIRYLRALFFSVVILSACASFAQVRVAITFGPPALPVYEQPVCPGEDYIWTPGYWAYDYDYNDYYWVPGTWVLAPEPGVFWTPGYWGWEREAFIFHEGYWGPHVGFYGGINYGHGYFGDGYEGGRWDRGHFFYNRSVNNVNATVIHNVYNTTVINKTTVINRVSYNGGNGGINVRPRPEEEVAERERHISPVAAQTHHMQEARSDPRQRAATNHGRPDVAATPRPSEFRDRGVVHASQAGGTYNPPNRNNAPNNRAGNNNNVPRPGNIVHPKDIPQRERPAPPNTGDAKRDQKYQQQQQKMYTKQDQQRQKLEQKQDQEHQRMQQQKANDQKQQQVEQHHQQQTQKLEHRQDQQVQKMQTKQQPRGPKH